MLAVTPRHIYLATPIKTDASDVGRAHARGPITGKHAEGPVPGKPTSPQGRDRGGVK